MYDQIFSHLDINDIRSARAVSKLWKLLVEEYRKRDITFVLNLTDKSIKAVIKSNESFKCVKVQDFQGQENKVVSSTRGTGRVFGSAEFIHLMGPNINETQLRKIIRCAVGTVVELIFQHYNNVSLKKMMLRYGRPFANLRKLVVHNY